GPAAHGGLLASVEGDAFGTLQVQVAEEALVPAGKREPGHGRRNADVDADHPRVEAPPELACRPAAVGEDRGAVAVIAARAKRQRLLQAVHPHDGEYRPEYLLPRQARFGAHLVHDARSDEEAAGFEL